MKGAYPFADREAMYAQYTDAALHYALRDALKARDTAEQNARDYARTHGPTSGIVKEWEANAAWYADDVHTLVKLRNRRRQGLSAPEVHREGTPRTWWPTAHTFRPDAQSDRTLMYIHEVAFEYGMSGKEMAGRRLRRLVQQAHAAGLGAQARETARQGVLDGRAHMIEAGQGVRRRAQRSTPGLSAAFKFNSRGRSGEVETSLLLSPAELLLLHNGLMSYYTKLTELQRQRDPRDAGYRTLANRIAELQQLSRTTYDALDTLRRR